MDMNLKSHATTTQAKRSVHKCSWTAEEDQALLKLVEQHGPKKWSVIASSLTGRIGKQCRERWHNHLNPDVRKDAWTPEEDELIFQLVEQMGTKWATIAKQLNGRTDNSIKNRYYSSLKKVHEKRKVDGTTPVKKAAVTKRKPKAQQQQQAVPVVAEQQAGGSRKRRRSTDSASSFVCDSDSSLDNDGSAPFVSTSPSILPSAKHVPAPRSPTREDFALIAKMASTGKLNMDNIQEVCAKMGMRVQVLDATEADEMIKAEGCLTMPLAKKPKVTNNRRSRKKTATEHQDDNNTNPLHGGAASVTEMQQPPIHNEQAHLIDPHTIPLPEEQFPFPPNTEQPFPVTELEPQLPPFDEQQAPWLVPDALAEPFSLDHAQPNSVYASDTDSTNPQTFEAVVEELPPLSLVSEYNSMLHVPQQP